MDAESTRQGVAVLFFLLAAFLIAVNVFSSRNRLQWLAGFLVAYGLTMSVFALIQYFTWNGKFYWLIPTRGLAAFGPFVNRNHFAGYMEMLMPIPIGLLVSGAARKQRIIYGFAAVMMGIAVLAAQSRGGLLAVVCEMILIAIVDRWFAKAKRVRDRAHGLVPETRGLVLRLGAAGMISVAILAGILWIGADPIIGRVVGSSVSKGQAPDPGYSRQLIWTGTVAMIKANPFIGVGFGAYETAYPIYAVTDGAVIVGQSHNDYLQIVADCGVVGAILTIWFLIVMARSALRALAARDRLLSGLALGCAAGVLGLLVHSLVDFNLQLPSNALLFLLLSAVVSVTVAISAPSPQPTVATGPD
jgi:O-antigen ligase